MVKRLLSACITVLMLVTAFSSFTALASTTVTVPSSLVNVAQGKSIVKTEATIADQNVALVVDGQKGVDDGWRANYNSYFVVDLGTAYNIDKVVIYDRSKSTSPSDRAKFQIYATNDLSLITSIPSKDSDDFATALGELTRINNTYYTQAADIEAFWPANGYCEPSLTNNTDEFRYVLFKSGSTCSMCEFEIYTDVAANDNLYSATKFINVAKHKPTTSSLPTSDHAKVVDDDFSTQNNAWHIGGSWYTENPDAEKTSPWVKIDLLRSYDIEKIVLYDRADSTQAMRSKFELYGTNDPDATEEDWEKIFFAADDASLTENLAAAFPANGCYVVPVTDKNYRYIIYKSTNSYYCSVREIQVFANVKVSEITRGTASTATGSEKGLKAGAGDVYRLTDGDLRDTYDFYSDADSSKIYTFLTLNLGKPQIIDMIEIYPITRLAGIDLSYNNIGFYGSNTAIADYKAVYGDSGKAYQELDAEAFATATSSVKLGGHPTLMSNAIYDIGDNQIYQQIWTKDATNTAARTTYHLTFNDRTKYQYLTYRMETKGKRISATEFAAYTIRPEAFGVTVANKKAYVNFSDYNMDSASINANNIKVYSADGTDLGLTPTLTGTQAVFNIADLPVGNYKVAVGQGVMNTYGTTLAEGKIFDFKVRANELAVTGFESAPTITDNTATLNITASNGTNAPETLFVAVALYDGTKLIAISDVTPVPVSADSDVEVTRTATVPEAFRSKVITAKAFCWYNDTLEPFIFE